jgi:hypothetical protein
MGIAIRMLVHIDRESKKTMSGREYLDQKGRSNKKLEKIMYWEGKSLYSERILGRVDQIKDEMVVSVHSMYGQMRRF